MGNAFSEVKLFQVRPDKLDEFEALVTIMAEAQRARQGCRAIKYMKRFFLFDRIGDPPRPLTKIVKCVKYYAYWEFEDMDDYAKATEWFFEAFEKPLRRLLIMPFDIHCGPSMIA